MSLRDGSGYAQAVVFKKAVEPEAWVALDEAGRQDVSERRMGRMLDGAGEDDDGDRTPPP